MFTQKAIGFLAAADRASLRTNPRNNSRPLKGSEATNAPVCQLMTNQMHPSATLPAALLPDSPGLSASSSVCRAARRENTFRRTAFLEAGNTQQASPSPRLRPPPPPPPFVPPGLFRSCQDPSLNQTPEKTRAETSNQTAGGGPRGTREAHALLMESGLFFKKLAHFLTRTSLRPPLTRRN